MNQQNMSKTPSSSASELPVKRKRGRPRKDESMPRNDKRQQQASISPAQPPPISAVTNLQPLPTVAMNHINADNHNMVGQVVTGVIDGVFDAGYLLSVRMGPHNTLRGLVFQQGHFCPITPTNDIAPHLKMCRREVFQIPNSNQTQLCTKQPPPPQLTMPMAMQHYQTTPMVAGGSSNSAPPPPPENLRMVEQDELMQVFEVSKMVEEAPKNDDCGGHGLKNDHLVSDSDLMAESVPRNDHPNLHSLVQDHHIENHESVIEEADRQKQQEGENPEPITRVETGVEEQPSFGKDMLQQESEKQGEVSKIDVNQDPNQAVASDLFQTN